MALNIKNAEAERLAAEVARLSNSSLTQAVVVALRAQREQLLRQRQRKASVAQAREFLERECWGKGVAPALDEAEVLGYGESGA